MLTGSPIKYYRPNEPRLISNECEFRIDLPFDAQSSPMFYIGELLMNNWSTQAHFHDHFELCYLDEGTGQYQIDKTLYQVKAGELWLTKPGEIHYGLAGIDAPFRLLYIGLNLEWMQALQPDFYRIGLKRVIGDEDRLIKWIFEQIIREVRTKPRLSLHMTEGLFLQLLVTVLRLFHDSTQLPETRLNPLNTAVTQVLHRLHSEIRYDHDIEEIAKSIPISRSHLDREFKNAVGLPIGEYMRSLCLQKAKFELRASDKPIKQIAEELHFSSIHTFSIFFKRAAGRPPSDYRKQTFTSF